MPIIENRTPVTLDLPDDVLLRVKESAELSNRSLEQEAEALLERGLSTRESVRASADRAYQAYKRHLAQTGQTEPTAEELMEQLRRIREEVADELDPN